MSYIRNLPYSVTLRPNGAPIHDPLPAPIKSYEESMGYAFDVAGVRVSTGSPLLDTVLRWGVWIGLGLVAYRMYRVLRYDEPIIAPAYRTPPAWEANPVKPARIRIRDLSPEEVEALRQRAIELYEPGTNALALANYLGVNKGTLVKWLKEEGVYATGPMGRRGRSSRMEAVYQEALRRYVPGEPVTSLARDLSVDPTTIVDWMKSAGVYEPAPGGSAMDADEKREILFERYEKGGNIKALAKELSIPRTTAMLWLKKAGKYKAGFMGRRGRSPRMEALYQEALRLYVPGEPVAPLARELGVDPTTVIDWMKKAEVYEPAPPGSPKKKGLR